MVLLMRVEWVSEGEGERTEETELTFPSTDLNEVDHIFMFQQLQDAYLT